MKKFSVKIKDLEVRSCGKHLLLDCKHDRAEIVQWNNNICWTIAYWNKSEEGYELKFVGRRPFSNVNPDIFMNIARIGQDKLDKVQ